MALDPDADVWRSRDGRAWRIGGRAEIAWVAQDTKVGLAITSAIPPLFEAYATLEHPPGSGEPEAIRSALKEWDPLVAGAIGVLSEHTAAPHWWLGFLDYGPSANIIFNDVRKVGLYANPDCYVLVEAGPEQAATWRKDEEHGKEVLPDLMFPADRAWLFSTLWDDDWTCIGGTRELVDAFLNHPDLRHRVREVKSLVEDATPPGHTAI
jgi:hypothetical protein